MEPALRAKVDKSLSGGRITSIGVDAVGVFNRNTKVFDVTTLDMISDIRQVRLETKFASLDRLVGSLASRLRYPSAITGSSNMPRLISFCAMP